MIFKSSLVYIIVAKGYKIQKKGGRIVKKRLATICMGLCMTAGLWNMQELVGHAETVEVPGYHKYTTTETEAIDEWFGIARGTYLRGGICGIKDAGRAKVSISATTNAHSVCDSVRVGLYLDESLDGGGSFGTIGVYHFEEENTSSCHGSKADIKVTSGRKYRARGGHSVQEGSVVETTTTGSNALTAS